MDRYSELKKKKRLILSVTSGRSGTLWLAKIFNSHSNAIGTSERYMNVEAFYRYIKYNKLNVDTAGIVETLKVGILSDWKNKNISMINSPFLSHDCCSLMKDLQADSLIWGITNIKFTVQSFWQKGWYDNDFFRSDVNKYDGIQPAYRTGIAYAFSRLVPHGEFFNEWRRLTRVGKIAWFISTINQEIYRNVQLMDKSKVYIFRLEHADQNYQWYKELANYFNLTPVLNKNDFEKIKWQSMKRTDKVQTNPDWNSKEVEEFNKYAKPALEIYEDIKR